MRGSQCRLGRLARTESASSSTAFGTCGYGTSHIHQASITASPNVQDGSGAEEIEDAVREQLRLLEFRVMPGPIEKGKARARDECRVSTAVGRADDAVGGAPQHQRRQCDAAEPPLEPRIVHV